MNQECKCTHENEADELDQCQDCGGLVSMNPDRVPFHVEMKGVREVYIWQYWNTPRCKIVAVVKGATDTDLEFNIRSALTRLRATLRVVEKINNES